MKRSLGIIVCLLLSMTAVQAVETVTLQVGETKSVYNDSVLNVINTHPSVITAEKISNQEVRLEGRFPGAAYVYIYNFDNKVTPVKVIVAGKKAPLPEAAGAQATTGRYSLYMKSDPSATYPVNQWMYSNDILLGTPTPFGQNMTHIVYKGQLHTTGDIKEQVAIFTTSFHGRDHTVIIGDDTLSYSELLAPGLTYQGVRTQLFDVFDVLDIDVFAGDKGNKHWGELVRDDVSNFQEVYGTKLTWKVDPKLKVNGTFLSQYDWDVKGSDKRLNGRGVGLSYQLDNNWMLNAEGASSVRRSEAFTAMRAQSVWQNQTMMLDCTVRDLTSGYETVSDYLDYRGQQGLYVRGRYRASEFWSLWGAFDAFNKRFPLAFLNKDYEGYRNRLSLALHKIPHVAPSIAVWKNTIAWGQWQGMSLRFSEINFLGPLVTFYYEFSPSVYDDEKVQESGYNEQRGTYGISFRPWQLFELRVENEWEYYQYFSGFRDDPRGNNIVLNYGVFELLGTTIKTVFSLRYQNRQNSERTIDQALYSGSLQLRDNFTSDLSWNLRFVGVSQHIRMYKWEIQDYEYDDDAVRGEISGGITYIF